MASLKKGLRVTRTSLVIFIVLTFSNFWYLNKQRDYDAHYLVHANTLRVLSQRIAKHAEATIQEGKTSFEALQLITTGFDDNLSALKSGEKGDYYLPPSPALIQQNEIKKLSDEWGVVREKVEILLKNKDNIHRAAVLKKTYIEMFDDAKENLRKILFLSVKTDPKNAYEKVVSLTVLIRFMEKISDEFMDTLDVNSLNPLDIQLTQELEKFSTDLSVVKQSDSGDQFNTLYANVESHLQFFKANIESVLSLGAILDTIYAAKTYIYDNSIPLLNLADALELSYHTYADNRIINQITAYILSVLTLFSMMAWSYLLFKESKYNLKITEEKTKTVQDEIQKLLEELTGLAKGDLTVHVGIREGITKEIAKAINYAVHALRQVIVNINKTTQETSKVAEEAGKIAKDLALSSEHQAKEISETTTAVQAMVVFIEKVSSNASQSETVALESVKIANQGGEVVRSTINGMEKIQAQIVDTSEKIRRLSESSQEISEIVSLIDGIAEQTNILSLNAAIQAATAGEAGKGFAVVADEVQQLAEKASYATREISSLVRSIQTDTMQVITAMEQTRAEVVQGVTLAQDAGQSLEKIEAVSSNLSNLVHDISMSAREQAAMSGRISTAMKVIREIANKTAVGTVSTAQFTSKLTQLIAALRHSVSEFKLPKRKHEQR